ncbi:MFS transporter [Microbaculum marinum]|uniref:MFS transporter n=1 Tax=Microbaculum marinum TaxID=1764581 RepID=A0AAW9RLP4_9HYPH
MPSPSDADFRTIVLQSGIGRVAILCLGVWLHAADSLLAATVMPSAVADIGGLDYIYWTIALYELGSISAGFLAGLLAVSFGLRLAMAGAALVYALGCGASAFAPDMATMLIGRMLQGVGGGWMIALCHVGMAQMFPERHWPKLLALISATWGASALVGPLIGGAFATIGLWRGAFVAFGLQAVVFAILALMLLETGRSKVVEEAVLPWRRLVLLSSGVLLILIAGIHPAPLLALLLVLAGFGLMLLALRLDGRGRGRLLPARPFDIRAPWGAGFTMVLTLSIATVSFTVYGPLIMESLFGVTPFMAGLMIAIESVSWSVAAIVFVNARPRLEPWLIRFGALAITGGIVGFALVMPSGPLSALVPWAMLQGAGFGVAWAFILRRIVASVPAGERERAASAAPTLQMAGYAIGAALSGIVANAAGLGDGLSPEAVERTAFWVFAAFLPIAAVGCLAAWRLASTEVPQA